MISKNIEEHDLGTLLDDAIYRCREYEGYSDPADFTLPDMLEHVKDDFDIHIVHAIRCHIAGKEVKCEEQSIDHEFLYLDDESPFRLLFPEYIRGDDYRTDMYAGQWIDYFEDYFTVHYFGLDGLSPIIDTTGIYALCHEGLKAGVAIDTYNLIQNFRIHRFSLTQQQ